MSEPVYTPNSHKYKEQQKNAAPAEKRVQKVVRKPVRTKKNGLRQFTDIFISEDVSSVKNYIFLDVIVPAIKKTVYEIVTNGIDMFLYGGTGKNKTSGPSGTKISYRNFYDQKNGGGYRGSENTKPRNSFDYEDIVFDNRGDAEAVKHEMRAALSKYGVLSVADLYDMVDQPPPYTSNKYGWTDLSSAEVVRVHGDYMIKLPKPGPLD